MTILSSIIKINPQNNLSKSIHSSHNIAIGYGSNKIGYVPYIIPTDEMIYEIVRHWKPNFNTKPITMYGAYKVYPV